MLEWMTGGESHGPALTAIMQGFPAGLKIDLKFIEEQMAARRSGYGRGGRMAIENDGMEFPGGIRGGVTTGAPIVISIPNRDWANWENIMNPMKSGKKARASKVTAPRPGHADLAGALKYGHADIRNVLERASARETAARTALGALAQMLLAQIDIRLLAFVDGIGPIKAQAADPVLDELAEKVQSSPLRCPDPVAVKKMMNAIDRARQAGDTLGGTFVVISTPLVPGLGSCMAPDSRLDARLAAALMSVPAVKGVETGLGFGFAGTPGSRAADEIFFKQTRKGSGGFYRKTNNAGGIEGGMTNGAPIFLRAVMKPIPTLMTPLNSVDLETHRPIKARVERSDVCAVAAASVVGQAVTALELARAAMEKFGGDSLKEFVSNWRGYMRKIGYAANL